MQCAAAIINDEPEKAISLLKQGNYYRVEDDVLLEAFTSQPSPITFTPDLNSIQTVVDKMVDLNYIKNDVPTSKIFDIDIVSELEK